ncbi:MAG: HNH endonuclease signature motif containing protein [Pseudomonadota bacterium]|jgi:5-methylcytosine-specific restriction endonuclease McrA|nr:endonuclease [Rhodovulum sp. NI22]MDY6858559.1 HNH endonuclease signature motif containing protein [Pseudomonadota bacterium]
MGLNRKRTDYARHSAKVTRGPRWKALRMQALDRDGWQCVQCGARHRLEVDHIEPVRDRPDLSYSLGNLQCLCGRCHARKTRLEVGHTPLPPERQKWRNLLRDMQHNPIEHGDN